VRTHESTRKLARHIERGTARIRSATVSHQGGRWFCSFSVEVERHDPAPAQPDTVVGVDLGITSLAVLSTGEVIANPQHLEIAQREMRRLQRQAARRQGPDKRTRGVPSQRWRTTQARVAKLHTAVANARRDGLHHLTTRLVREHPAIVTREPERRRDAPQPAPRPPRRRCRLGRTPTSDRVQTRLGRQHRACTPEPAWTTVNEPDGNPHKTRTSRAAATATGRPTPTGAGQRRRGNAPAQDTCLHVS
jgi:putative transposase